MINPASQAFNRPPGGHPTPERIVAPRTRQRVALSLSSSALAEAIARFEDEGGIIARLPDGPEPMRFTVGGHAVEYAGYETVFQMIEAWEAA